MAITRSPVKSSIPGTAAGFGCGINRANPGQWRLIGARFQEEGRRSVRRWKAQGEIAAQHKIGNQQNVAQNTTNRSSALDRRTTRHAGYALSQQKRKRVEESFGWMKIIGLLKKLKLRGLEKVSWLFTFVGAAYKLVRLQRLQAEAGA